MAGVWAGSEGWAEWLGSGVLGPGWTGLGRVARVCGLGWAGWPGSSVWGGGWCLGWGTVS